MSIRRNSKTEDVGLEAFLHLIDPGLELPQVDVIPESINLRLEKGKTHEELIYIKNIGRGILSCTLELSENIGGVFLRPHIITTNYGQSEAAVSTLQVDTAKLDSGRVYRVTIIISTNSDQAVLKIPLAIMVEERQKRMRAASAATLKVSAALAIPFNLLAIDRMSIYYGYFNPLVNPWDAIIFILMGLFLGLLPATLISGEKPKWYIWVLFLLSIGTVAAGLMIAQINEQESARIVITAYAIVAPMILILSILMVRLFFYYYPRNSLFFIILTPLTIFLITGYVLNNLANKGPVIADPNEGAIYLLEPGGYSMQLLGPGRRPYLSSEGNYIAYSRRAESGPSYLYTRNLDGDDPLQLSIDYAWLDWSPEVEKLAFVERARHYFDSAKVRVVKADGTEVEWIMPPDEIEPDRSRYGPEGWLLSSPLWSPDGNKIAFYCQGETMSDWYIVVHNFLTDNQILAGPVRNLPFRWQPDQSAFAYINSSSELILYNAQNGQEIILAEDSSNSFQWSPDGNHIAYMSMYGNEIFIVDSSGEWKHSVTSEGGDFIWSPDGQQLAYATNPDHGDENYLNIISFDGSNKRRLGSGYNPLWSPDARFIAYINGNYSYIMNVADGEYFALAEICEPGERPDYRQVYYWWSPEGDKIAYLAWDYEPYKLYIFDIAKEEKIQLSNGVTYSKWIPHTGELLIHRE